MERRILINSYAKDMIKKLQADYPDFVWYLTIKDDAECIVGFDSCGVPAVVGRYYEDVINTLNIRKAFRNINVNEDDTLQNV